GPPKQETRTAAPEKAMRMLPFRVCHPDNGKGKCVMSRLRSLFTAIASAALLVVAATGQPALGASTTRSALAPTAGCGKTPTLNSGTHTITTNGKNRSFILRIPDGYDNTTPYRLIFGFHWNGGTANDVDSGGTS